MGDDPDMSEHDLHLSALRALLPPDLAAALDRDGDLPAPARQGLAAELRGQLTACAAYIPARLVRGQLERPEPGRTGGAFWEGSLLFADLSGFTALSERLSVLGRQGAEEVSAVVNALFAALIAEIQARNGALLKFGGDAITAFFDADGLGVGHAPAAAAAALAMQARMAEFASVSTRAGSFALQLRVGVHSGRVFAAEVGDDRHVELVVTGPEVNLVALAQEIATPGEVVVSERTAAMLPAATLAPRAAGFQLLCALPATPLPSAPPALIPGDGPCGLPALAALAAQLAALRPYLVHGLPRRFLDAADAGLGEFRPVTVLFANVHDFSAILEHVRAAHPADPERAAARAAAVLNAYFRRAQAVVHRYDGAVNKVDMSTHGDKLMALFGAPVAHEDDPTRAVRCALELQRALEEANEEIAELVGSLPRLSQKIGINTGTVFAGRVGGATRYEYTVMGPAVNLAARLMAAAADGELLLSPSARAAVGGQFLLDEAPPLRLKGLAEPVAAARVRGLAEVDLGGQAELAGLRAERLIGRDAELAALQAGARLALAGQGRVLAVVGEAGAGKSRLIEELVQGLVLDSVADGSGPGVPPFEIYLGDCQSYEQRTPYAALRGPLRDLLGLSARRGAGLAALAPDIEARVGQLAPELLRFAPLLGDALGLALPETPLSAALSPQQRHDRLQELIVAMFAGAAARDPLLVAIEDAHWADGPSLELLAGLAAVAPGRPLLLALTYRPDPPIPAPWDGHPDTVRVRLGELPAADSTALLAALLGVEPPPALLPLLERTQGNPFFIEELVRGLILAGILVRDEAGTWRAARALDEIELPKSIEGLLIARLDRLDEPRQELVQVASVIGRRFQRPVIEGVYANPAPLGESLERLVGIELIQAEQLERNLAYIFRHALLRDVAYAGILYARRRVLHGRVARRIEQLSGADLAPHLSLLAWHYLQAEEWRPALQFHLAAADQARRRFANHDALALYEAAREVAERLAPAADPGWLAEQRAAIHEHTGDLHALLGAYDEAERHYRRALELAAAEPGPAGERWLRLHRLLAAVAERRSRYDDAFASLHTGLARATAAQRVEVGRCYLLGAGIYYRQGEYLRAMEWARMAFSLAEQSAERADETRALKLIGNIFREQGDLHPAIAHLERARAGFELLNQLGDLCEAINDLGITYDQLGRWQETAACYERSLQISESIGDVLGAARAANNLAVLLVGRDQLDRAADLYRRSSDGFARIGSPLGVAVTTYNRGEVLLLQSRPAEAMALFERSIADFERINARTFLPEVLRLAAEAALAQADHAAARAYAARSLAIATDLGVAAEGAAARRVLGQVALIQGDHAAAADLLADSHAALAQLDNRYELGKTLYQLARLARATGDPAAFAAARDGAAAIFVELDAQRDLALLAALGWRPAPAAPGK